MPTIAGDISIVDCHGFLGPDTVQGAIDAADDGDVIVVLPNDCNPEGRYFESIDFLGKEITVRSANPSDPAVVAATIIDGSLTDEMSVVTMTSGETQDSILDGLTITGGTGTLVHFDDYPPVDLLLGGGIYCHSGSPKILNCNITANRANYGGGVALWYSEATLQNCQITQNAARFYRGTYYLFFPFGGGLDLIYSGATVKKCLIADNLIDLSGPPYFYVGGSNTIIGYGAGVRIVNESPHGETLIAECDIRGNSFDNTNQNDNPQIGGGGVYLNLIDLNRGLIKNTLITQNTAREGGGVYIERGRDALQSCTIAGNRASLLGQYPYSVGGVYIKSGTIAYPTNSIVQHNEGRNYNGGAFAFSNVGTTDGSVVPGEGNINEDPLFVDEATGDYHLLPSSPCVEAGDPAFVPEDGETDIDGDPRVMCAVVDMGADEVEMLAGDVDRDGNIDKADLHAMVELLASGVFEGADFCTADLNGDGQIDWEDFHLLIDLVFDESCIALKKAVEGAESEVVPLPQTSLR